MIALEIETPIINHRINVSDDGLPANIARAKLIVLYEEEPTQTPPQPLADPDRFERMRGRATVPWRTDELMRLLRGDE
jgi:hypothetical protein